ncbi:MAG TPA: twin-arginine translocase TatA/TatE family subunit [Candidatus Dormibacteraeota bacterium]|nr:twin-arginine translocase TatA/TatE family subunit [Candidatus Dormibacteraeota bacterium]
MPFFNHWWALLLVLILVLIIWGPGKLPEVGGALGKAMREFRKQSTELTDEIRRSTSTTSETPPPPSPSATDVKPGGDAKPAGDIKS